MMDTEPMTTAEPCRVRGLEKLFPPDPDVTVSTSVAGSAYASVNGSRDFRRGDADMTYRVQIVAYMRAGGTHEEARATAVAAWNHAFGPDPATATLRAENERLREAAESARLLLSLYREHTAFYTSDSQTNEVIALLAAALSPSSGTDTETR